MKVNTLKLWVMLVLCASAHAQSPFQVQSPVLKMRVDGPEAVALGKEQGYKTCPQALLKPECRVGAWSEPAPAFSRYAVKPSANPWPLPNHEAPPEITWRWASLSKNIDDFMDATQTTGLLIIHKGKVVAERYQYDRKPGMPMPWCKASKPCKEMMTLRSIGAPLGASTPTTVKG